MQQISSIYYRETARFDRWRIEEMVQTMGEAAAEALVGRTLEQIAIALNRAERAHRDNDGTRLVVTVVDLVALTEQVGLTGLADVARSVLDTARSGNAVALGATLARMIRVGEGSLMSVRDVDASL